MSSIGSKLSLTLSYVVITLGSRTVHQLLALELPPELQEGGHSQFLTNLALYVTIFYFSLNAVYQLFEIRKLAYARQFVNAMAISLEFIVTYVYWGLRLVNKDLIMKGPGIPLSIDLTIHALPFASLVIDYFCFMDPWTISKKEALVTTSLMAAAYWWHLKRLISAEGHYPYPFLDVDDWLRAVIFAVVSLLAFAAFCLFKQLRQPNANAPKVLKTN
ncbi:hypothetical protein KL930_003442 [Ogataea haglerorum]|uniref:FAR-17a/AIG1-like protein n=1 Tax=Ogataea haglerorum TaxID=1937702 RepID=A0AAN6D6J6_9ASCO|nr:uncharacterized protein KL911_003034 [Ogataea haglerorum]KAG7695445.1 hypothetical protein KL915_002835 [Ogataea haglerorum]KAG7695774.1 hypothetical protein KL951_003299 [Ogataea haglerorum]KAG7705802.1 hypothetical protein KL914_003640 [Ogataea haglerorum]KAG7707180.1 hypothetical protein KL950_002840 [Ogataea haglerorum]KAG7718526.1 hypothetical protein KL913_002521 [Ogataea haglerorum]